MSEEGIETDLPGLLKPGMRVYIPGSSGEPSAALKMLAAAPACCSGVEFITSIIPGINRFDFASLGPDARFTTFFMHPSLKQAFAEGRVRILELPYSGIAAWLAANPVDLVIVQLSREARSGYSSLGPTVQFSPIALLDAGTSVAVLNHQTPWLHGSVSYSPSEFDFIMESDTPLPAYPDPAPDPVYDQMGAFVASLIPDGATIQTGLGQAPAAVLDALSGHRNLKLHTGVFSDSLLRLVESGAFQADTPLITGVAVGSGKFYQKLKNFPEIRYEAVTKTHGSDTLARIPEFFAINSAVEVDLQGNVNAEFLNGARISGRGGLPDFAEAGSGSSGGASIIVVPSTDRSGKHSRIVGRLSAGATVEGRHVDYVITEFGCARLKGCSPEGRAAAMTAITAPHLRSSISLSV
jgi:acyl-CoA hydrolase